ncbi:MAG TPA: hypothetical protein PKU80_02265 [Candidatus Limiplasma sp.]|nr:hypothetical protein [Candidatus Limiplasma sp.]HRX07641.1 hypothetical protein [Candidatus Limiplasma sp.]
MLLTQTRRNTGNTGIIVTLVLFVLLIVAFVLVLNAVSGKTEQEQAAFLENAVRRAVVTCFAIEGRYPPSLQYLAENYGMEQALHNEHFIVSYTVFASNIFPDIAVLRVGESE